MTLALVTGGAGFIGRWVAQELLDHGWDVRVFDNLSTGSPEVVPAQAELIIGDIRDVDQMERAVQGCQTIFHLAAFTVVGESITRAAECCDINVVGTASVLQVASKVGVKRVVFTSSSAVYSGTLVTPISEETVPEPGNVYGHTKAMGEGLVQQFGQIMGLESVILRYFNVYGPGQTAQSAYPSVVPAFLTRLQQEEPLMIHGDGQQTRDFVYVEDVARANRLAAEISLGPAEVPAFNVATSVSIPVLELAAKINRMAGRPADMVAHDDPVPGDQQHNPANIDHARDRLGWTPSVTLDEGLPNTWDSWQSLKPTGALD